MREVLSVQGVDGQTKGRPSSGLQSGEGNTGLRYQTRIPLLHIGNVLSFRERLFM